MGTKEEKVWQRSAKMWLLQLFESGVCVHSAVRCGLEWVNLSSDSLVKNISDTKRFIQDLSQEVAEIKEGLRTEPSTAEDDGKVIWQR